ncbi:MAG: hypothetical protein JF616_19965 [Fibrobacteres bacterium]|nr:hypothetical protein [Fibrobacterota bacterium]
MSRPLRVFVSAGEASGDAILGKTLARLRAEAPDLELAGLGGPRAEAEGLRPLFPISRTAFSGAGDALVRGLFAIRLWFAAARALRDFRPDLALLVDYPGLNMRLARLARSLGVPVHFIAPPQAWAYRHPDRKLRKARRALAGCSVQALYAFESDAWRVPGLKVTQGHFQDTVTPVLTKDGPIALCPGSRLPVLKRNLPAWLRLLDAAELPQDAPLDVIVPAFLEAEAERIVRRHAGRRAALASAAAFREPGAPGLRVRSDAAAALAHAPRALAFPGTITLELARNRVPTLVMALLDPLTYALGKRLLAGRRLALPNLIVGEAIFPEWAGTAPGPDTEVFRSLWDGLASPPEWESRLAALETRLGPGDGASVAVAACLDMLRSPAVHREAVG